MGRKKRTPEENERRAKIRELLQMGGISSMEDIQKLFKETIAEFMENGLDAELDEELGYSKYDYKNKETATMILWKAQEPAILAVEAATRAKVLQNIDR